MSIDRERVLAAARIAGGQAAKDHAAGARVRAPHVLAGSLLMRQAASEWHRGFAEASPAVVKLSRVTDLNGEVTWRDSRDGDEGGYAAGGGGAVHRPHTADGIQYVPGGVPGSTAGGEPSRWDGGEPEPRVATAPDDGDDASYPGARGVPPRPGGDWPGTYMDGWWPQGGHGTGQAGTSSPGGANGRPPNGVGKRASDPSDPNPVDAEHVKSLMLANFPASALGWVDDARWIGPVEVPQDRIDTDDEDSWAASGQPKAVKRFAKAIKHGTGHTHPVILVQSPGNPRAVVIDGHHRTLAYRKLGRPVKAYVGQVNEITPEIAETHSYQLHSGGDVKNKAAVPGLTSRSGMISLDIPDGVITPLPGGLTDFHVTIVYLGPDVDDDAFAVACERVRATAAHAPGPLAAMLTGISSFPPSGSSDGKVPVFIPARIPGAEVLRAGLEDLSASEHKDWKPHVTLAYQDEGDPLPEPGEPKAVTLTHLSVHRGDEVERFPLGGASKAAHGDGNAERLREYWAHGEGAALIRWGEPGDFDRCVLHVGKYMDDPKGYCAERHHEALGIWPATHAAMERGK